MSFYKTLLSVTLTHSYNQSGVCSCLKFYPSEKTQAVLKNAGLVCKEIGGGIQILYDQSRLEALELYAQDPQEALSFDFKVYSQDPEFGDYTEPFAADADGVFCFDNRATNGSGPQKLPAPMHVSFEDLDRAESNERRESELRELKKFTDLSKEEAQEFKTLVDLNDQFLRELNHILSRKDRLQAPEFVLRIYAANQHGSLLEQWLAQAPTVYSIGFNSRKRYWKYYLTGRLVSDLTTSNDFEIVATTKQAKQAKAIKPYEFEATGEKQLSDKRLAYTFRSKTPIPCQETYPFRFELKQKGQSSKIKGIENLPIASNKRVGIDTIDKKPAVVSEIYINS